MWPESANASLYRDLWLSATLYDNDLPRTPGMTYNVSLAAMNLPRADGGLPVGHYVATMHFVYAPASGAPLDVSYDVMLDVVP